MTRRIPDRSGVGRLAASLTALVLTLALVPLLVETHSTPQAHSALDQPVEIFTEAVHPAQPAHFDAAASEERDRCTYCVLQLKSAGSLHALPVLAAAAPAPFAEVRFEPVFPASSRFTLASPRAPPFASAAA